MASDDSSDLTALLIRMQHGDDEASNELYGKVYPKLRAMARRLLGAERRNHSLQASALVNEVYLKLSGSDEPLTLNNRAHFFSVAARAFRQILVDHAKRRNAARRGGGEQPEALIAEAPALTSKPEDVIAIDEALSVLQVKHARKVRLIELRYFMGLSIEETAEALGVTATTVKKDWEFARAFLLSVLENKAP